MPASGVLLNVEQERIVPILEEIAIGFDGTQGEVVLDFSSVRRIDAGGLRALEDFLRVADEKAVKVVLRGVHVDVYKVFKLVNLAQRISFLH